MKKVTGLRKFLDDITPFFYGRYVTYVDVGAYTGRVFRNILASKLVVNEAHLIEPNARFLDVARCRTQTMPSGRNVDYYQLAVGASEGRVRMHDAKTMTRVIGASGERLSSSGEDGALFEVDCTTLEKLVSRVTERHISLLKIDVEGYELEVLSGAKDLLQNEQIDVLYVEAGMNPKGTQQCYYREIEDTLTGYGYRLFGVYEQVNEWLDDSPVLRRVNLAFFSDKFSKGNPYRLTHELYQAKDHIASLQGEIESTYKRNEELVRELKETKLKGTASAAERNELAVQIASFRAAKVAAENAFEAQRASQESLEETNGKLQQTLENIFDGILQFTRYEARTRKIAARAQDDLIRLRGSYTYRLGSLIARRIRSPVGWIKMPFALMREYAKYRRDLKAGHPTKPVYLPEQIIEFPKDEPTLWIPLKREPQMIVLGKRIRTMDEVWITAFSGPNCEAVTLSVQLLDKRHTQSNGDPGEPESERKALPTLLLQLNPNVPKRLNIGARKPFAFKLFRKRGKFCILKMELRETSGNRGNQPDSDATINVEGVSNPNSSTDLQSIPPRAKGVSALELEKKLWGGFARYAIPLLENLKMDTHAEKRERVDAAWYLLRWYYFKEDYANALEIIELVKTLNRSLPARFNLAAVQCFIKLRRYHDAENLLNRKQDPRKAVDFQLLRSTVVSYVEREQGKHFQDADSARLSALNECYQKAGLALLRKKKEGEPLNISNIMADAESKRSDQTQKVSVIVPAFNSEGSIIWVIDALLRQTWRNLEIIVVDDCSTDGTYKIVHEISERDSRVKLVSMNENRGAYAARNRGLQHASGELVTVHDSDDWSHPQRIELQVNVLLEKHDIVAVKSHWTRVTEDLDVLGAWQPRGTLIDLNFSSLLFRKDLLRRLGSWDDVRVSGDAEFYSRLRRVYGNDSVFKLPRHLVLSLSLSRRDSLTQASATHLCSLHYGLRWHYRASYLYWHSRLDDSGNGLPFDSSPGKRRFPLPLGNRAGERGSQRYDLVVVSDFAMRGGAFVSTLHYVVAASKAGKRVAVYHWRKFDLAADAPLQPRMYEACLQWNIDILGPGDNVSADVVLIGYPAILQYKIDPAPQISTQQLIVIINQFASRLIDGGDPQYDPRVVRKHLKEIFGMEGVWVPISSWVKRLLEEDDRYPTPYVHPWSPMIDVELWCKSPIRWRGDQRAIPVVGRHGRDTYTKWPSDADVLAQAYGVGEKWDVRFLGGADHAVNILRRLPENWTIIPFDRLTAQEFLKDIDFYVHYTHEKYIEEFGRAVMEAMALGIPTILPPRFRETFGEGALYAEPASVSQVISELWVSKDKYLKRAIAGREFVEKNCDMSDFIVRLDNLLNRTPDPNSANVLSNPSARASAVAQRSQ